MPILRTETQIKAAHREISRVARKTPKRVIDQRKPGPCFVTMFPSDGRVQQMLVEHEEKIVAPKKKNLPTPISRATPVRVDGVRRRATEEESAAPAVVSPGSDYAAALNNALRNTQPA